MTEPRTTVYRGTTRTDVERAYYAGARAAVHEGYVPAGEEWSTALGQERLGVRPGAARQALRRLTAGGHIDRVAVGHRGRYAVRDRLFQRYLELQTCEP